MNNQARYDSMRTLKTDSSPEVPQRRSSLVTPPKISTAGGANHQHDPYPAPPHRNGTAATDIQQIVVLTEAFDSGPLSHLCRRLRQLDHRGTGSEPTAQERPRCGRLAAGSESRLVRRARRGREAEVQPRGEPVRARRTRLNAACGSESRGAVWKRWFRPSRFSRMPWTVCSSSKRRAEECRWSCIRLCLDLGIEATPPMEVEVMW